ncbi:MAG: hypothetical protein HPY65_06520 [Syntrophaceae bacterium]|nr:hypothetical protein [Syntrophaceae bacterium]
MGEILFFRLPVLVLRREEDLPFVRDLEVVRVQRFDPDSRDSRLGNGAAHRHFQPDIRRFLGEELVEFDEISLFQSRQQGERHHAERTDRPDIFPDG